jgi:elongation factor Ts
MVEIRCETDFCSLNDEFQTMADAVADMTVGSPDGEIAPSDEMKQTVQACFEKIGENMSFGRGFAIKATKVGSYVHHNNKVGVIVGVDADTEDDLLAKLCMHIAFSDPLGITEADLPAELLDKERAFAKQEAIDSGKPEEIAEKMVVGKMKKFIAERALMEQKFVHDDKVTVKEILGGVNVTAFARYKLG